MSSTSAPFGFRPVRPGIGGSGSEQPLEMLQDAWATGYASSIGTGCAVSLVTDGTLALMANGGTDFYGVFSGCFYVDGTGRERTSACWIASTAATNIRAFFWRSPFIEYFIQANGSLAQSSLGDEADQVNGTVATSTTGHSTDQLSTSLAGAGNPAGFRITGLADFADNAWGDTYTIVRVLPNEVKGLVPFTTANAV